MDVAAADAAPSPEGHRLAVGRERLERLFKFLREFHQVRHPIKGQIAEQPWFFWLRDLPDHSVIRLSAALPGRGSNGRDVDSATAHRQESGSQGGQWPDSSDNSQSDTDRADTDTLGAHAAGGENGENGAGENDEQDEEEAGSSGDEQEAEEAYILRVRRPELTSAPRPPEVLREWLQQGWDDPEREVQVWDSVNRRSADRQGPLQGLFSFASPNGAGVGTGGLKPDNPTRVDGNATVERFADAPERVQLFESWKRDRDAWAVRERPARAAMRVFEQLYELYGRLQREGGRLEFMLGDGVLSWRLPSGGVYHPVLLQRVQLEFDPSVPEFVIRETDDEPELYTAVLRQAPDLRPEVLTQIRDELRQGRYSPLGGGDTAGFLRRLVQALSPRGRFTGDQLPRREEDHPVLGRSPVLFLRERMLGFVTYVDEILEDIKQSRQLPGFLLNIVGAPAEDVEDSDSYRRCQPGGLRDILFSKPWNQEQLQIAGRLAASGAVVVQGPPGTGMRGAGSRQCIGRVLKVGGIARSGNTCWRQPKRPRFRGARPRSR